MPTFTEYSIAAGHNNAVGLVLIGAITATNDIKFAEPMAQQNYHPPEQLTRLDLLGSSVGIDDQTWLLGVTWLQYRYLKTTYCGGGFKGKVTVRTHWQGGSYANYNAILEIPRDNLNFTLNGYHNVPFTLWDLRAI